MVCSLVANARYTACSGAKTECSKGVEWKTIGVHCQRNTNAGFKDAIEFRRRMPLCRT
ncbi:hypothetical protein PAXRUDRAFT_823286 [Paxillus rubicundulus Ve08.2h10]|uniref:Unplaced genomic scaffold scaffold_53, whole genome shotgun sequence n=1 Tax=Paxillus rubicundulus Ve08.2h10 TaxID=930991 RepID=A0A0D0EC87_9AGAM|nr:hypothetical protein PAXRUDRAFT_823286 [Paxillus rubicundulus Ve08.2h10]